MVLHNGKKAVISRRHLLAGAASVLVAPTVAFAEHQCQPNQFGQQVCYAQVPVQSLAAIYDDQNQSQWCWAASIAMLFNAFGYRVSQERIVQETFGGLFNMPAGSGSVISQQINRSWRDDGGRAFRSQLVASYDFDARRAAIDNPFMIAQLADNRPMIYGNRSHAMLFTRIDYVPTPMGPNVFAAGVLDPWPGIGPRSLSPIEMVPMHLGGNYRYLAAVHISPA